MQTKTTFMLLLGLALTPAIAHASGLELATEWSWYRDGGRIVNGTVVIGIFVWLVVKFGGPILRKRTEDIANKLNELELARTKAEVALKEYESKLALITDEGEKIKQEAIGEAEIIKKKIIALAEEDAKKIVAKAAEQINIQKESAKTELRRQAANAAIALAKEVLQKNIGLEDQKAILANYLSEMEKVR